MPARLVILALGVALWAGPAGASGSGAAVLARANDRWEQGAFGAAEKLYAEAIDRGELAPSEVLACYVHLGVARLIRGSAGEALAAFREAALIDPRFVLPPEATPRATALAQQARHEQQRIGAYRLDAQVPESAQAGQPIRVSVELDKEHAARLMSVRVVARDPASGKTFMRAAPAETSVAFELPAELASSDQPVSVRFDGMDERDNRLVSVERQVRIERHPLWVASPEELDKVKEPGAPAAAQGEEGGEAPGKAPEGEEPWNIPHGSRKYTAIRADKPPTIDGKLDDPIWAKAPKDTRFFSTRSKPYGQPTTEPTTVQVAFDQENLYVAFRCAYSKKGVKNDSFAGDEQALLAESETVSVIVDALHGHTGAWQFTVSPAGVRGDVELSDQGANQNLDWRGIWDVQTQQGDDGWTAEFKIPLGTMRMPARDEEIELGVNFSRREPISGEYSLWALHPPATEVFDTNFFGHLEGLANLHPGQRLFLQPYVAGGFDTNSLSNPSALTNLTGASNLRAYAGLYARFRPPGPVQVDATFNPDFSAVTPDQALANYDRFELEYPEVRPFFAEDKQRFLFGAPRYLFGDPGAQLFYSRRFGIETDTAGLTQSVPILWGVKSVLSAGGTEAAVMNVQTTSPTGPVSFFDNATVARVNQTFEGQRIGAIFLASAGNSGGYVSGGLDGAVSIYDRHLEFSGFYATSQSKGQVSGAGEGTVYWKSQDIYAKATYLEVGSDFDAPLGYFPLVGIRSEILAAGYSPVVRNDRVQQLFFDAQLSTVHDRATDDLIYTRGVFAMTVATIEQAIAQVAVMPSTEVVTTAFPIGNGRITVAPGTYKPLVTSFSVTTAPSRPVVFGVGYQGGDLYAGTRRAPSASLGFNLGRFTSKLSYQLYILKYGTDDFLGHDVMANASYAYTPLIRSTLLLEADTVAARGVAQLATTWQFGMLSTLTFTVRGTSGSTLDVAAVNWTDNPNLSAIVSFAYGMTPF